MTDAREFFETLETRVDRSKTAGMNNSYLFDIDGAGKWKVDVSDGNVTVMEGGEDADAVRILASGDGRRQAQFAQDTEVVGMRTFMPASLVLFLAAIGMMINAHWSWGQNWIVLGLIAFGLSFVIGAGFLGPESGRLAKLIASEGPESPAVKARIRRILMVSRAELVVLVTVVWNMVVKPVGLDGWFWGSIVVMVVGVAALVAV